jgi:2-furoate---CoA ligase
MYTVDKLFKSAVERSPDIDAIVDLETNTRYTYSEMDSIVDNLAAGLSRRGIETGDRVAICLRNTPEHVFLFLATQRIGAVAVPFNFRVDKKRLQYHLSDASPRIFVFDDSVAHLVREERNSLACDELISVTDGVPGVAPFSSLLTEQAMAPNSHPPAPDDLSVIQYSSGTTGQPKGIKITQRGSVGRVLLNSLGQRIYNKETMIGVMPLYHTVGLHGILLSMLATSGTYLPMSEFDPDRYVQIIGQEDVTVLHEVPTIVKEVLNASAAMGVDFESVNVVTYSASSMSDDLFDQVKRDIDPAHLFNVYGLTEAYTPRTQLNLRYRDEQRLIGGSNVFHSTRVIEIGSDDPTAEVPKGREGELIIHMDSPCVFEGYWNRSEESTDAVIDDWFFSGDIVIETDNGNLTVTGRADNLIISGGENIYPEEIEDILTSHPEIRSVAVVGVPDEKWGEVPKAHVITSGQVTKDELDKYCLENDSLSDFKRPRRYEMVEQIPRNAIGKKLRNKLN